MDNRTIELDRHRDTPALHAEKLNKVYRTGTHAVKDITLTVHRNDFMVIIGSSGAGKSSLLRCMNRLVRPTSGSMSLFGDDITHVTGGRLRAVRSKVGMIFQQFHLVRRLSVIENVLVGRLRFNCSLAALGMSLMRLFPASEKEMAFECLKQVGIADLAFQRADTLSGGQQQRVAIARALAQQPQVFLADEPIASLDPHSAETVMGLLQQIHETHGIPVLVNLHHIDFAKRYGKRVVGMRKGALVLDTTPCRLDDATISEVYGARIEEAYGSLRACA